MDRQIRTEPPAVCEVEFSRIISAFRNRAFDAWVKPALLSQWWGPHGFTNPLCKFEARTGGIIRIVMRSPEGQDYPMSGTVTTIVPPSKLSFANFAEDASGRVHLEGSTTVTFTEQSGKTKLDLLARAVSTSDQGRQMLAGMEEGWSQSLERLEAFLTGKLTKPRDML